jgi:hypothetical protein
MCGLRGRIAFQSNIGKKFCVGSDGVLKSTFKHCLFFLLAVSDNQEQRRGGGAPAIKSSKRRSKKSVSLHPSSSLTAVPQYKTFPSGERIKMMTSVSPVTSMSAHRFRLVNSKVDRGFGAVLVWDAADMVVLLSRHDSIYN